MEEQGKIRRMTACGINEWKMIYHSRQKSAKEAIFIIQADQKVFHAPFCNEPQTLVEELVCQKDRFQDVYIYNAVIGSLCFICRMFYQQTNVNPYILIYY